MVAKSRFWWGKWLPASGRWLNRLNPIPVSAFSGVWLHPAIISGPAESQIPNIFQIFHKCLDRAFIHCCNHNSFSLLFSRQGHQSSAETNQHKEPLVPTQLLMTLERSFHPTIPPCVNFFIQEAYKWVHPQSWKHFWVAFEISKLCSKFSRQLDGNSWDDQIADGSINTFPTFFSTLLIIHHACASASLLFPPLRFLILLWQPRQSDLWPSQGSEPLFPTFSNLPHLPVGPLLPPPLPLPPFLAPSVQVHAFFQLFFFTITFPVGGSTHRWDVACRFTRRFFGFHVSLT